MAQVSTDQIKEWRSIITLVVFVIANIIVLFPFHVPIYIPRRLSNAILDTLSAWRVISSPRREDHTVRGFVRFNFPLNFVTAPLIADLFLLAISAIGRKEVHDGTVGADNISPIDIMAFFLTLAYIAISIDASGLVRFLAFKVLQKGGKEGHRLFFYLYAFFFGLGSFMGNDPIILSGTAFLAYMTRVSSNILHPRAWIFTQFAVANIASAILVSSNPTNLVLAGAFKIKFLEYTANMIVPVAVTAIVLFPFLLYIIFADESLVPVAIEMHELPEEAKARKPVNPNIPNARGRADGEEGKLLSLEEIMNPFLDKGGAIFGTAIMAATLITILAINAASQERGEHPVFWVTLPAAVVMFCWDLAFGWKNRHETREIARKGRQELEQSRADWWMTSRPDLLPGSTSPGGDQSREEQLSPSGVRTLDEERQDLTQLGRENSRPRVSMANRPVADTQDSALPTGLPSNHPEAQHQTERTTIVSWSIDTYRWLQETFPTATAVVSHMPFAVVPFALSMFVLVQALATKGWIEVFARGWDHWVKRTGTVGSIGGMGFLSFAGTNIGTTILLSRVIQQWQIIHEADGIPISNRTFWATVYSMALGVNYGAFSAVFSTSLAGLLWRDILARKHIRVDSRDFARVNLPIIAVSMAVGCAVLVGEVYITREETPYRKL
ncbi:hypothetical protein AOCH_001334 [Aspergillus ochraceoroseus]|uniref:Citrate transporter-like domain-containing protein n=1 Tax=Aspergillus ochraceoroseus TaxID=138278 RepID=A0A0F8UIA4_9EURO|nr:hypothetical protein AOCH_001334 [Aspergillus ochraceoroseus]